MGKRKKERKENCPFPVLSVVDGDDDEDDDDDDEDDNIVRSTFTQHDRNFPSACLGGGRQNEREKEKGVDNL